MKSEGQPFAWVRLFHLLRGMILQFALGEQLESIHLERQRAQAAYDLLDFYSAFSRDDTSRLDAMKKEGREGRRQVGVILRRLNIVAKEVDLSNAEKVHALVTELSGVI
jgi:hypothetical protein